MSRAISFADWVDWLAIEMTFAELLRVNDAVSEA